MNLNSEKSPDDDICSPLFRRGTDKGNSSSEEDEPLGGFAMETPTLPQLVSHPIQAECLLQYLREAGGEGTDLEAIVALHMARQTTLDDLRKEEFRKIWNDYILSRKIPLSSALVEEIQAKTAQVESNPLGHQDIFYKFEQEILPRLQEIFPKFLESELWKEYMWATSPEIFRKLKLKSWELNNFPPLPFPSRDPLRVARYILSNALDLVRIMKANIITEGRRRKIDVKFCLQTKTYNLMCQGAAELRKVSLTNLNSQERLVFFLNVYNTMVIHGHLAYDSCPIDKIDFLQRIKYNVAGFCLSLNDIRYGILGAKGPKKMFLHKIQNQLDETDLRRQFAVDFDPRLGLFLAPLNTSLPIQSVYTLEHLDSDINSMVSKFINATITILDQQIVLPKACKDLKKHFGGSDQTLNFVVPFLSEELKKKVQAKPKWKISYASQHDHHPEYCWIEYDIDDIRKAIPVGARSSGLWIFSFSSPKDKRSLSPSRKTKKESSSLSSSSSSSTSSSPLSTSPTPIVTAASTTSAPIAPKAPEEDIDPVSLEKKLLSKFSEDALKIRVIGQAANEIVRLSGPEDQSNGSEAHYGDYISARVISTYPHVPTKPLRDGDPICDRVSVLVYENRAIVTMTDGCNWGVKARDASLKANESFMQHVAQHINELTDVQKMTSVFLRGIFVAHERIMDTKAADIGTTTILGGVLCEVDPSSIVSLSSSYCSTTTPSDGRKWAFFCLSVGDCKAYHYSVKTQHLVDITKGNRKNLLDARDPGGRLGPYNDAGTPDLRNIAMYYRIVEPDDVIFVVSDGVHDNFDPQLLGVTPQEMGLDADTWANSSADLVEEKKYQYSTQKIAELLKSVPNTPEGKAHARKISNVLIEYASSVTSPSRDFMVNFPKKKLPIDYKTYPGKMDHTSCISLRVGEFPTAIDDPDSPPATPQGKPLDVSSEKQAETS
eukprot:TRINITY_DN336_c0_g1_i1.p1 TRINITY_DN336_c0_g1~~TRINITY_DN336_c0_g1_i1.p1  ORF type:complete len:945 (+),score=158.27 TRINITY_DN336_c0_g1_i1:308-3142(+)